MSCAGAFIVEFGVQLSTCAHAPNSPTLLLHLKVEVYPEMKLRELSVLGLALCSFAINFLHVCSSTKALGCADTAED